MKHLTLGLLLAIAPTLATAKDATMQLHPDWEYVADTVMGGVSTGQLAFDTVGGSKVARLTGDVSLDNNGGFVQMAFDLNGGAPLDASGYTGIELEVYGNAENYDLRLRTDALQRPWQSFRTAFTAPAEWTTVRVPFDSIEPHKTDAAFDPAGLRRMGVVAIGREFRADIAVRAVRLYR